MRVKRKTAPTSVVAAVKRAISRTEETKSVGLTLENATQHNAPITNADIVVALPGISQGTTSSSRVGDRLRPVRMTVRGSTSINDQGFGFIDVPVTVKVMILQAKGIRDSNLVIANADIPNLMENGGTSDWNGTTERSLWKVNNEEFQVLGSRTFKLGDSTAENTKCLSHRWSINVKTPKTLTFGKGALYPSNFAPFMVVGWCRDDGSIPSIGQLWVVNTAVTTFDFKDA